MITYKLKFSEYDEEDFNVYSFEGESCISSTFEYRFILLSEKYDFDMMKILNKKATFQIKREDQEPNEIYGIISHFEQVPASQYCNAPVILSDRPVCI